MSSGMSDASMVDALQGPRCARPVELARTLPKIYWLPTIVAGDGYQMRARVGVTRITCG
jgi:hypothetical protein